MDHSRPDQNAEKGTPLDLRRLATVLAAGFFSTTLAQPEVIELPLQGLLKEVLHLSVTQMSLFFSIGALAWYCKPFVGIIADSYPLLGTHRLGYIVLGAVIAAACWLAAGVAPLRYTFLLGIVLMINAGLVIASTAVGGLLVEVSRRYDASARLVPMRSVVTRACLLVGGPLGGFLATFAFGLSTTICAVVALLVVPIAMIWLHERAAPKDSLLAWQNAKLQIRGLLHSRSVWGFAALAFLVLGVPDFHDRPLYYYRIDVLHFSPNLIGWLKAAAAAAGFAAAFIYYRGRPRCSLEWLIVPSLLLNAAGALAYLLYASPVSAVFIDVADGFLATILGLVLMEIAVKSSPSGSEAFTLSLLLSVFNLADAVSDYFGALLYDSYTASFFFHLVWINAAGTAATALIVPSLMRWIGSK